jgi:hypothetical protein
MSFNVCWGWDINYVICVEKMTRWNVYVLWESYVLKVLVFVGCILLDKNHFYVMFLISQGCRISSKSSNIQSLFLWYGNGLIMTRSVPQASRRNFWTPRRLCKVYNSAKVGSWVCRPNGLVKRLDTGVGPKVKDSIEDSFR